MRKDFIDEIRLFMRIVFNVGDEPLPMRINTETVNAHSRQFTRRMYRYAKGLVPSLRKFLQANMPQQRPAEVVYPFGGGDLLSALLGFPDAPEFTTISLEQAGAPSRIRSLTH